MYSRSNRTLMLKQKDQKSSREVVKDPTSTNATSQELITKTREDGRLKAEN